jgi:hypothetical protein
MSKARDLADSVAAGGVLADGAVSVSEITSASGVDLNFVDNSKAVFGAGSDLQIWHDGTHSTIKESGAGDLLIYGNNLRLGNADGSELYILGNNNAEVQLRYNNATKLATTTTGIDVTGDVGGDTLTISGAGSVQGLTVGRGAGAVVTNVVLGEGALASNSTGNTNTAVGSAALAANTASGNSAFGRNALTANTTGSDSVSVGRNALATNTTGSFNVAVGKDSLTANTTASNNVAVGYQAGYDNTTGDSITAVGMYALTNNTTANYNNAFGRNALYYNTTGTELSAVGYQTLQENTTGSYNTAIGNHALQFNTTASNNVAVGYQAGYTNTTGTNNTYTGWSAGKLATGNSNTAFGSYSAYSLATGSGNTFYGTSSGGDITTGSKNTIIGSYGGNQGGLDIRTANNYIVLSDGDGNPRLWFNGTGQSLNNTPATYAWNNQRSRGASTPFQYIRSFNSSPYSGYGAEYVFAVEMYQAVSTGSTLTIPIRNQSGVWVGHQIRIRGVAVNFNQNANRAFTADISLATATSAVGFASSSTGNIASIAMSGTNIVITFTTAYAQTTASTQVGGVSVYIEHLCRTLDQAPILWASIAMN